MRRADDAGWGSTGRYRELIAEALGRGRNAMAIWQDLVDDHGFTGRLGERAARPVGSESSAAIYQDNNEQHNEQIIEWDRLHGCPRFSRLAARSRQATD